MRLIPDKKGENEPAPKQDTGDDGVHPTEIGRGGQTVGQSHKPEYRQKGAPQSTAPSSVASRLSGTLTLTLALAIAVAQPLDIQPH
jgi:hypothetical protein